jgi:hypothetical protein
MYNNEYWEWCAPETGFFAALTGKGRVSDGHFTTSQPPRQFQGSAASASAELAEM